MPYWDELSVVAYPATIAGLPTAFVKSASYQRTFRTRGGRGRDLNIPVPDSVAEPYSHFDSVNSLKKDAYTRRFGNDGALQPDRGHAWELVRFDRSDGPISFDQLDPNGYPPTLFRNVTLGYGSGFSTVPMFTDKSYALKSYAQQQYAKAAPHGDAFSLAQFLGELREGLPALTFLKGSSLRDLKRFTRNDKASIKTHTLKDVVGTAGGNYVGYQFALAPLVSDLQELGMTLYKATSALTGFCAPIHRRREKVSDSIVESSQSQAPSISALSRGSYQIPLLTPHLESRFSLTRPNSLEMSSGVSIVADAWSSVVEEHKMWFEAEYVLVPKIGFDPTSYVDKLEVLMNTDFTISSLWELSPWSWLADWALNIGDSIRANETASSNRLVTNYAYAMSEQTITSATVLKSIRTRPNSYWSYSGLPSSYVSTRSVTVKRRIRANPYGFNPVASAGFNTEQWAILGALAASKGR